MTLRQLELLIPLATWLSLITSVGIPYLSALATKAPSWSTGFITALLSTGSGFFSEWAAHGSGFAWKAAAGTSLLNFTIAAITHHGWLKGTDVEAKLYAFPRNLLHRVEHHPAPAQAA